MYNNNLYFENENEQVLIEDKKINYTLIETANEVYAIETKDVLEIIKVMELDYPNELPSCILGILKYEETPAGVIDLREVFKKDRITYGLDSKIIVIKTKDSICAVICDRVLDVKRLSCDKIKELPYQNNLNFFKGLYIESDKNAYILDIENIVKYINNNPDKFINNNSDRKYLINDETSKQTLKHRKNFLIKTEKDLPVVTSPLYNKGVSFIIDKIKYYINMEYVKEFFKVNNAKFIKIPSIPDYIFGLINIKGDYITVIDIRKFFNKAKTQIKEKSTIIILNSQEFRIGILADEICESMDIMFDEIMQNKTQKDGDIVEFVKDGEMYQILDIEKMLSDERLTIC